MPGTENPPSRNSSHDKSADNDNGRKTDEDSSYAKQKQSMAAVAGEIPEVDDFGLPIRKYLTTPTPPEQDEDHGEGRKRTAEKDEGLKPPAPAPAPAPARIEKGTSSSSSNETDGGSFQDAPCTPVPKTPTPEPAAEDKMSKPIEVAVESKKTESKEEDESPKTPIPPAAKTPPNEGKKEEGVEKKKSEQTRLAKPSATLGPESYETVLSKPVYKADKRTSKAYHGLSLKEIEENKKRVEEINRMSVADREISNSNQVVYSEFSHQQTTAPQDDKKGNDGGWQTMPAYAPYDIYDDDNKLIAKEHNDDDDNYGYAGLGGAGKGYTRVLDDEDAESETSLDGHTKYLFQEKSGTSMADETDEQRDAVSQLQATKDLLTEGQRIAYVGMTRLELFQMVKEIESMSHTKKTKKDIALAGEAMKMWAQKIMIRLYAHMEISPDEQIMIEQLAEHGVMPGDLSGALMQNARVKNPMAEDESSKGAKGVSNGRPSLESTSSSMEQPFSPLSNTSKQAIEEQPAPALPKYESHDGEDMPEVKTPNQLPTTQKLDIDLRWTVLCDLFLVLIADSIYDARSRVVLERVGKDLEVPWLDICRFEKRVTDALEMQQQAEKENWNEEDHLENRRKMALKRKYVMMGLATVGGGLVIGLSAGLLAPLIGAGLAAGFTTIGVTGTGSFLAGAGGAAIITAGSTTAGGFMGGKAANRRMGAVRTFEYRPLHNNKRVNLIVTISGWMTSKVDDVRLPFSTVDPIMGDMYSILWEPEMLTSMGDTINILATEALTQGLQQVLGSTILISLMAALQLPVVLSKLAYLIDNPWAVSQDRAWAAGLILADSLIDRNLGTRPVTLVGYSLGSRVIFSCLMELARKGAFGLVQNVYMFGSPVVVKKEEYLKIRSIVAGRFVNGYNRNDWILGYLFRLTNGGIRQVAGLATVDEVPGIENMDCTEHVQGHMDYRQRMPKLLGECGWLVESDEFSEIEDPDPDRHRERQIELINEIEEARKELEKEGSGKKSRFSFFSRKKAQKAEWEVYEDNKGQAGAEGSKTEGQSDNIHGVLFDVDAIRAELAKEQENPPQDNVQPKELKSTLPPIKIAMPSENPRASLHETRSYDASSSSLRAVSSPLPSRLSSERTPTFSSGRFDSLSPRPWPSSATNDYYSPHDEVQMTFDTAYHEPAKSPYLKEPEPAPARPEIKSSQTTPNLALHDPWADDDDPDFGKEKEISMTFA